MIRARALFLGLFVSSLASVASVAQAAAPEEDPFLAMCKRDGKNILESAERAKTSKNLATEYDRTANRFNQFESTCITGPKVAAIKSSAGYADVTAADAKIKTELAGLKQRVDAAAKAEQDQAHKRQAEDEQKRLEQQKRDDVERAAQVKKREDERAAENARRAAEDKAWKEKKAKEYCTLNGQLSNKCFTFLTTIATDSSKLIEHQGYGYVRGCFERINAQSPDINAAEELLAANDTGEYAAECLRLTDTVKPGWRKRVEDMKKREVFAAEVEKVMASSFKTKCGVSGWLEDPRRLQVVLEKKSASKATFFAKKNGDGDLVTIYCSGVVTTQYAKGGSSTSQPKTEASLTADRNLRACALEKAKYLCPGGKIDFERGMSDCVKVAEAACH
jgi:flagellar biosynthesis GTPase FlhF